MWLSASAKIAGKSSWLELIDNFFDLQRERQSSLGSSVGSVRILIAKLIRSRSIATVRLACWLRRSLAPAVVPVGMCSTTIAVSTLLRCCPPGPPLLVRVNLHCLTSSSTGMEVGCDEFIVRFLGA